MDRYEPAAYVEDLEAIRVELGAEGVVLLGHSWGGYAEDAVVETLPACGHFPWVDCPQPTFELLRRRLAP